MTVSDLPFYHNADLSANLTFMRQRPSGIPCQEQISGKLYCEYVVEIRELV
jgi:hypothetical protein